MKFFYMLKFSLGIPLMFKDPCTALMENIIELHHIITFFLFLSSY